MVSRSWRSHTAAHARRRNCEPTLSQLVGDPDLTKGWLLNRERNDGVFDLLRHAVFQDRLSGRIGKEGEERRPTLT